MEGDVSCNLESVNIAAELINGELKDLAFRGFLKRSNALLAALNDESSNGICLITSGLFLDKVFVESSEEERERFADVVNQNLDIVSKAVEFTFSFWKNSSKYVSKHWGEGTGRTNRALAVLGCMCT